MKIPAVREKMLYCPKCNQKYRDGSQRFCTNEGERLLPETSIRRKTGIRDKAVFTNLLGKTRERSEERRGFAPLFKTRDALKKGESGKTQNTQKIPNGGGFELPGDSRIFTNENQSAQIERETGGARRKSIFKNEEIPAQPKPAARLINQSEVKIDQAELGDRRTKPAGRDALGWENPEILLGKTVKGRYEIFEILDRDDASIAYLAKDRIISDKKAIVRVLMEENSRESLEDKIFAEERVSLSHINHPNVAKFIDSGELPEGKPFIVTQFVEGESVKDVLDKGKEFNPMRVARIIGQASYALSGVHQNGISHRSLKPKHILLTVDESGKEQVKVKDFGVSSGRDSKTDFIYKSPEQVGGHLPTFASDTYSLAVIAFEMLTGQKPFEADSPRLLLKKQKKGLEKKPSELKNELPPLVDEIIAKALSFDASERYPKARDFGEALYNSLMTVSPWENDAADETENVENLAKTEEPSEATEKSKKTENFDSVLDEESAVPLPIGFSGEDKDSAKLSDFEEQMTEAESASEPAGSVGETAPADIHKTPSGEALWERRSPDPVKENSNFFAVVSILGVVLLLAAAGAFAWQYFGNGNFSLLSENVQPSENVNQAEDPTIQNAEESNPAPVESIEVPPPEREFPVPPDSKFFENSKQNLDNELAKRFRGFSLYYPQNWELNKSANNFFDAVKKDETGYPKEQFLVTFYESDGTFDLDREKFPDLVENSNRDLEKILADYQVVSQGNITVNNGWKSFEVKFKGNGYTPAGKKIEVWGRRIWMPAARQGVTNGFVITMFATSFSDRIESLDDVGKKGDLGKILYTFEPDRNY